MRKGHFMPRWRELRAKKGRSVHVIVACAACGLTIANVANNAYAEVLRTAGNGAGAGQYTAQAVASPQAIVVPRLHHFLPQMEIDSDPAGAIETFQPGGAIYTPLNAFFQSLGTNGRACVTCHEPANAMSLSVASIRFRYYSSKGLDPLFAPVDAATCPKNVRLSKVPIAGFDRLAGSNRSTIDSSAYATLLNKGLFRISLSFPANAEFTISVVSDPYGCETDPLYSQTTEADGTVRQIISVYRRPIMAANLKFKVTSAANSGLFPPIDPITGDSLPRDAQGNLENGNLMADGREPTLVSQAINATLRHAQALKPPTAAQVAQIVQFESGIYTAQYSNGAAEYLAAGGAGGTAVPLASDATGTLVAPGSTEQVMNLFDAWNPAPAAERQQRASIWRGEAIFNTKAFDIADVAGVNNAPGASNPLPGTCASCHGQVNVGASQFPVAQLDVGIGGDRSRFGGPEPSPDLPVFLLTCTGTATTAFNGNTVLTNDPGKALVTGKCADIGRLTVPQLRGLAARAPYFTDGSAARLIDVIHMYEKRFHIALSALDETDLVNFLNSL